MFETDYGTLVCGSCGNENFGNLLTAACSTHSYSVPLQSNATYTRLKRFKKYLNRSTMSQSQNSIPAATWDYLLAGSPYSGPDAIVRRLKKAPKHIRKKCYDSLPLLVHHLCPDIRVPRLSEHEKKLAIEPSSCSIGRTCTGNHSSVTCTPSSTFWSSSSDQTFCKT